MRYLKKALCAALAAMMILMGTSCDVLMAPANPEEVTEKTPIGNYPSESTPGEADSVGGNPAETAPSESEKGEETEEVTIEEEITEEVTTVEEITEEVTTVEVITEEVTTIEEITEEVTTAHVHAETVLEGVAPTCTETGLTEGVLCGECGEILVEQEVIPAVGHTPGADATCTEPQNCTVCGEMMNAANGHIPGAPANCTTAQTCTVCHIELAPAKGHTEKSLPGVEPTCTATGLTEGVLCGECGEILVEQETIPATGHTPGADATCTEVQICAVCHTELTPAKGHTEMMLPGTEPTCTEAGLTDGVRCGECGEILVEQEKIAATGHIPSEWIVDKEPDWGIEGNQHTICTECGVVFSDTIDAIYSQGLEFTSNRNGTCYVSGIGTCTDLDIWIPPTHNDEHVVGVGDEAFLFCQQLTSVHIPDSVTTIGNLSFYCCTGLISVTISNRVTSIGDNAFTGCRSLTSISLPDSLTSIGFRAFESCGLSSIHIPVGVTSLGEAPFFGCSALTNISVAKENPVYHSAGNCLIATDSKTLVLGCKNSNIPTDGSVTRLGEYAFCGCSDLTTIVIPDSVTDFGSKTFYGCSGLTSIKIPEGVTAIGELTFYGCQSLISVVIPNSVTSIGSQAFWHCSNLDSLNLPASVTDIGHAAFWGCKSLSSIHIPNGATRIDKEVFSYCSGLTFVVIPNSVVSIDDIAFNKCSSLTDIYFTGTESEWEAITKGTDWDANTGSYTVHYNYVP